MTWTLSNLIAEVGTLGAYIVAYGTITAYVFFALALLLAILFPAIQMVRDFKKALKTLAGVGIFVVIFLVCYTISVAEPMTTSSGEDTITVSGESMKMVEAWLYMTYVMFAGAILAVIIAPLSQYIKK